MPKHTTSQIRNVALVGHADAGKTTLADHLLAKGGAVGRPGSVKEKTSLFDFDDLEQDRGHSVDSACGHLSYQDREINLIDCPGYPDFIGESVGGYNGADLVLVCVNAANGIQVNTKRGWALGVGGQRARAIVVTKCELPTAQDAFAQLTQALDRPVRQISAVTGAGLKELIRDTVVTLAETEST